MTAGDRTGIDRIDARLVELLQIDGRRAYAELGAAVGISGPAAHDHGYDKTLVCVSGSIVFGLVDLDRQVELRAGDRLDLPAGTKHDALVGDEGVTCLESHLPADRHGGMRNWRAGEW